MCIRDSVQPLARVERQVQASVRIQPRDPVPWCAIVGSELASDDDPCLLYTSDAADERSSVDLGGRRIIKKKKHKHLERSLERQETESVICRV